MARPTLPRFWSFGSGRRRPKSERLEVTRTTAGWLELPPNPDSARNPAEWDVRNAQEVVNQAAANLARLVNPSPFDVHAASATDVQAQARSPSRRPTAEEIQIAAAQVDQAVASLSRASESNQSQ